MATWIKETDKAIYWMEGEFYIDKLDKTPSSNGESKVITTEMKTWFASENPPGTMVIVSGDTSEPQHKPISPGHGEGNNNPRPPMRFVPASESNYNSRSGTKIDMIIVHNTDGSLQGSISTFQNPKAQVSAHYIVARNGEIIQMVQDSFRAWHAGNGPTNSRSIGIEHVADESNKGLTSAQEQASISLIKYLMETYDIQLANIKRHHEVSTIHGGTDCPGWIWPTEKALEDWKTAHLV